jgi:hypothetical protein
MMGTCPSENLDYVVPETVNVHQYFHITRAKDWNCTKFFKSYVSEKYDTCKLRNEYLNTFKTSLEKIHRCNEIPGTIRQYAKDLKQQNYIVSI